MAVTAKQLAQDGATSGQVIAWDGAKWSPAAAAGAAALASTAEGRLTLSATDPVPTSDMTAQGTLYYLPYLGRKLSIYDGSAWQSRDVGASGVSASFTGLSANTNYDVFAAWVASAVTLEFVAWTSDTVRATLLVAQDGVWCKTGDLTRRYLGTVRTVSPVNGEDSLARRFVWNATNRAARSLKAVDPTSSWTYSTGAFRAANANTTLGEGRVGVLCGEPSGSPEAIRLHAHGHAFVVNNSATASGVGVDSTTTSSAQTSGGYVAGGNSNQYADSDADWSGSVSVGFHYFQRLEYADGASTTWYGSSSPIVTGLTGEVWA